MKESNIKVGLRVQIKYLVGLDESTYKLKVGDVGTVVKYVSGRNPVVDFGSHAPQRDMTPCQIRKYKPKVLEVGAKVRIKESSTYYGRGLSNPDGTISGTVSEVRSGQFGLPIRVIWDNGNRNSYSREDLELV